MTDYVSPQEVAAALASLRPVRGRLNRHGSRKERQAVYWLIEALKREEVPVDDDALTPILYVLPPASRPPTEIREGRKARSEGSI